MSMGGGELRVLEAAVTSEAVLSREGRIEIVDADPLLAAAAAEAVADRRTAELVSGCGAVRIVGVHGLAGVAACPLRRPAAAGALERSDAPTLVYVARDKLAAELHRLHCCADAVAVLHPGSTGARFELLSSPGRFDGAGLTPREVDVLALLLARRTNAEIAGQLVVSLATVRSHCRSTLRKVGAKHRRALWDLMGSAEATTTVRVASINQLPKLDGAVSAPA
jgi:DNA-binding CsgD family transcriptional regulator